MALELELDHLEVKGTENQTANLNFRDVTKIGQSDVDALISAHNLDDDAHPDIRNVIATEVAVLESADAELADMISAEERARSDNDATLETRINNVDIKIDNHLSSLPRPISTSDILALSDDDPE
jgi:hypothetical protein